MQLMVVKVEVVVTKLYVETALAVAHVVSLLVFVFVMAVSSKLLSVVVVVVDVVVVVCVVVSAVVKLAVVSLVAAAASFPIQPACDGSWHCGSDA